MMKKFGTIGILLGGILVCLWGTGGQTVKAWDGDWTDAPSNHKGIFDEDPDSTEHKTGTPPPQKFLTPDRPDFADVDPDELKDYFQRKDKNYAPYALLRVSQIIHYGKQTVPLGYYLVKLGKADSGSPNTNLKKLEMVPTPLNHTAGIPDDMLYQVFVIKKQEKVIAVIPIERMFPYAKPTKAKKNPPNNSFAWMMQEERQPVLKVYSRGWIYATNLE